VLDGTAPAAPAGYDGGMTADLNMLEEREVRITRMMEEFRAAQQRRLVKRGIALWNRSEATMQSAAMAAGAAPPAKA
jgi:hypothetical protein